MQQRYLHAVIGGTFDHLHIGHEALIDTAMSQAEQVTIGLSLPSLYKHKELATTIEPYEEREKRLLAYLKKNNFATRTTIVPITDLYGPTITDPSIDVIVVTKENMAAVVQINLKRHEHKLPSLGVTIIPTIVASDGHIISSQRIREGYIDRQGHAYLKLFKTKNSLLLPEGLREVLREPIGSVVKDTKTLLAMIKKDTVLIAVGDVISQSLQDEKRAAGVSVIDFKTRRHTTSTLLPLNTKRSKNEHGTISQAAVIAYHEALTRYRADNIPQTVVIDGEEDLLALPAILLAPLGACVVYGQYGLGIVVNEVTEALKEDVWTLIQQFH